MPQIQMNKILNFRIFLYFGLAILSGCHGKYTLEGAYDSSNMRTIHVYCHPTNSALHVEIHKSDFFVTLPNKEAGKVDWIQVVAVNKEGKSLIFTDNVVIRGRKIRLNISDSNIHESVVNEGYY